MKKTVKSEIFENGEYKIETKKGLLTISCSKKGPIMEINRIEVKGEMIKDEERALELAAKYILDLEQGAGNYNHIENAFKIVKEYTTDLDSYYGEVDVFLGDLVQNAYNSFSEKVKTKFSADDKSYIILYEGNVECKFDDEFVKINGKRFALESGEYGISDALSQISETTDFLSKESLETYEMLKEKFD